MEEQFSDIQSSWMKFSTIGNQIIGTLVGTFFKEGSEGLPDQQVYQLVHCTVNGEVQPKEDEWNVGVKTSNSYITSRMSKVRVGQRVRLTFEAEIPPTKKGMNPAKSIKPEAGAMDPEYKTPGIIAQESVSEVFDAPSNMPY